MMTDDEIQARARAREAEIKDEWEKRTVGSVLALVTTIVHHAGLMQRCCEECGCLLMQHEQGCINCAVLRAKRRGRG